MMAPPGLETYLVKPPPGLEAVVRVPDVAVQEFLSFPPGLALSSTGKSPGDGSLCSTAACSETSQFDDLDRVSALQDITEKFDHDQYHTYEFEKWQTAAFAEQSGCCASWMPDESSSLDIADPCDWTSGFSGVVVGTAFVLDWQEHSVLSEQASVQDLHWQDQSQFTEFDIMHAHDWTADLCGAVQTGFEDHWYQCSGTDGLTQLCPSVDADCHGEYYERHSEFCHHTWSPVDWTSWEEPAQEYHW